MTASPDNAGSANAPSAPAAMQQPNLHLPVELWAQVLHHVDDDYTLWVICRQVSQTFRAEAEREFALTRLPLLDITCSFHRDTLYQGRSHDYECNVYGMEFESLIEDGSRAQFSTNVRYRVFDIDTFAVIDDQDLRQCDHFEEFVIKKIAFRDLDFKERCWSGHAASQIIELGYYFNVTQLTKLVVDLAERTLAFDWQVFLNDFYRNNTYVQARKQFKETLSDLAEQSIRSLHLTKYELFNPYEGSYDECMTNWESGFGEEDDDCFNEAYFRRLRFVHDQAGIAFSLNNFYEGVKDKRIREQITSHFAEMRLNRNYKLIDDYRSKHNIHVGEYNDVASIEDSANEVETADGLNGADREDEVDSDEWVDIDEDEVEEENEDYDRPLDYERPIVSGGEFL